VLAIALVLVARPSAAWQQPISTTQGHAQIIAQTVSTLPAPEAAWRVAYHTIEPGAPQALPTDLSFTLVDQGTLLAMVEPRATTQSIWLLTMPWRRPAMGCRSSAATPFRRRPATVTSS
jgi:hypothetical protein